MVLEKHKLTQLKVFSNKTNLKVFNELAKLMTIKNSTQYKKGVY